MSKNKKTIFWDIGNVLIQDVHKSLFELIYQNRVNEMARDFFDREVATIIDDSFYGAISLEETWEGLRALSGIDSRNFVAIKKSVEVNDYNRELINQIKKMQNEFQMGIISDLSQIGYWVVKKNIQHFLDMCSRDLIFISLDTFMTKMREGENLFTLIKSKINILSENSFFIDDSVQNVELANRYGFNGIHFKHEKGASFRGSNEDLYNNLKNLS